MIDGKETKAYSDISYAMFSPNSRKVGYIAQRGYKDYVITVDDKEWAYPFPPYNLQFDPTSSRFAFTVEKEGDEYVIDKGYVGRGESEENRYFEKNREFVVIDGQVGPVYDEISDFAFSPDGKRFVYSAIKGDKGMLIENAKETISYSGAIVGLTFSPDRKQLAYIVRGRPHRQQIGFSKSYVVINGKEGPVYEDGIGNLAFSPNSKHVVYFAFKGENPILVIDGKEREFIDIGGGKKERIMEIETLPQFSRDNKLVMFGARLNSGLWWIVQPLE